MTLFAVFRPEAPIIISDVLLSHLGLPKVRLTPTGVEVLPKRSSSSHQPVGFSQKTVLLDDDRVVFTGAGKVSTLKSLAADLRDEIRKGMGRDDLESWMLKKNAICGQSTSVMISWGVEGRFITGKMGNGVRAFALGVNSAVFCGGSGADWLKRNLIKQSASLETIGDFHDLELVRAGAIAQTAQHLAQERFFGLRDDFGGGFQIAFCDGERFVRVSQVVYLVFLVEHNEAGPKRMTLSGPLVVQRWKDHQLAFELWQLEGEDFTNSGEGAVLQTRSKFTEQIVPPLLYSGTKIFARENLSTGEYVSAQIVHHREGKLVGLGSFQLMGDPTLNKLNLSGQANENITISLSSSLFETWMMNFVPIPEV